MARRTGGDRTRRGTLGQDGCHPASPKGEAEQAARCISIAGKSSSGKDVEMGCPEPRTSILDAFKNVQVAKHQQRDGAKLLTGFKLGPEGRM
jgi:hypothetical protein